MPQKEQPSQKIKINKENVYDYKKSADFIQKRSEQLMNKLRPVLNAKANAARPDFPLAPTPEPKAIDNTFVKKPIVKKNI